MIRAEPLRLGSTADDGRVVPVFAVTGGRTRSVGRDLPVETLATASGRDGTDLQREYRLVVELAARRPVSLVEVGAHLQLPFGVARVLVSDLAGAGYLNVHVAQSVGPDGAPTPGNLTRLLDGLRGR